MAVSKDEILDAIAKMSLMEVVELMTTMEKKFGVTAAAPVAAGRRPRRCRCRGPGRGEDRVHRDAEEYRRTRRSPSSRWFANSRAWA